MERPLCTMICEDCGKFAVMHENAMSIFVTDSVFFAISRCTFCDRIVTDSVEKGDCFSLFWRNVKVFNFNTGEQILDNQTLGKI